MLKLELDWAGDEMPVLGTDAENGTVVELVSDSGPAGWPVVKVLAVDGPALWAWLAAVYGSDDDEASELASMADWV